MPDASVAGGLLLVLVRGLAVAGMLLAFGTPVFAAVVLRPALARAPADMAAALQRRLLRLARGGAAAAILLQAVWLALEAVEIAGDAGWRSLAGVATGTRFGHIALLSLAALAISLAVLGRGARWRAAAGAAGLATVLRAGNGHALAMSDGPSLLLVSQAVHLLAAGAWLGGLPGLLMVVWRAPPRTAAAAARWFSPLGRWCVVAMAVTAAVQGAELVGSVPGLVGTAYGWVALGKLAGFVALLGFAVLNRYRLAPALLRFDPVGARRSLLRALALQSGAGLLTVLAAGLLASLPPPIHEQPSWPFPVRPSLLALQDPDLRREVLGALVAVGIGGLAAVSGIIWRRVRWSGLGGLLLVAVAAPHLGLLFVPAYPTSYYVSPTGFAATSIVRGAALFGPHCAACHGAEGAGDGPAAAGLPVPPADLTAEHLWEQSDGELFWWLTDGMRAPDGRQAMPGFVAVLSEADRWDLIDYIRAHNAGVAMRDGGEWSRPVPAPGFTAECPGGHSLDNAEVRGQAIRLVIGGEAAPRPGLEDIFVGDGAGEGCRVRDPALPGALAVLTDESPAALAGAEILVDRDGWLRARLPSNDPAALEAALKRIAEQPLAAATPAIHHH